MAALYSWQRLLLPRYTVQCTIERPRRLRSKFPPHSREYWGITTSSEHLQGASRVSKDLVLEFLSKEGIFGAQIEHLDLPESIDVIKERLEFIRSIGLDNTHIERYPMLLCCSVKRNMVPVVNYLDHLGFTPEQVPDLIEQFPMILYSSVVIDLKPVVDYLLGYGVEPTNIPEVLLEYPNVLGFKLEGTMSTSIAYLVSLGINKRRVSRIITSYPQLLGMKVGNNIKCTVEYYLGLGFSKQEMVKLLERHTYILGYDLEHVRLSRNCLVKAGIQEKELHTIIYRFPEILGLDLENILTQKIHWLTERLHIHASDIPKVLHKLPQIVMVNETKAEEKVEYLHSAGIRLEDVGSMLSVCPQILALRTIKDNMEFYIHEINRPLTELVGFPHYLTYDLRDRIKPRYEKVRKKGINCSLAWFLDCGDERFKRRLSVEFMDKPQDDDASEYSDEEEEYYSESSEDDGDGYDSN